MDGRKEGIIVSIFVEKNGKDGYMIMTEGGGEVDGEFEEENFVLIEKNVKPKLVKPKYKPQEYVSFPTICVDGEYICGKQVVAQIQSVYFDYTNNSWMYTLTNNKGGIYIKFEEEVYSI